MAASLLESGAGIIPHLFEITALGSQFALIRWVISVVGIIIIALLISKIISKTEQSEIYARHANL